METGIYMDFMKYRDYFYRNRMRLSKENFNNVIYGIDYIIQNFQTMNPIKIKKLHEELRFHICGYNYY